MAAIVAVVFGINHENDYVYPEGPIQHGPRRERGIWSWITGSNDGNNY